MIISFTLDRPLPYVNINKKRAKYYRETHSLRFDSLTFKITSINIRCRLINMRCALVFICIILDLHLITLIYAKLLSISSNITIKKYFFDCIQRGGVVCGQVKRGTVRFVFGTRSNSLPPPPF